MRSSTRPDGRWVKRHGIVVRATHWINALCLVVLLMSGLQIFNAHPALYLGQTSTFDSPVFAIDSREEGGKTIGYVALFGHSVATTGVLGVSSVQGRPTDFIAAWLLVLNGLVYLLHGMASRHLMRDIVPDRADLAHTGQAIVDHARLRFPTGEAARRYNVLQKLAYAGVIFVALPLIVLAGWTMSPALDTVFPVLTQVFGGRQTARTIHFVLAVSLVGFFVVHVAMVVLSGVRNNMRAITTGWFDLGEGKDGGATHA